MAFYSIINISKDEYEQDKLLYKSIVHDYKKQVDKEDIYLELSLSSYALKEKLSLFKGIKNLSIGSVYKEKHLDTLLKLKELGFFDLRTKNTEVFCPIVSDNFLNLIEDDKFKDFDFIIPVYNSEDLDRVYTGKYKKIKIFPFIVNDIASLIKSLSAPFPEIKEKTLSPNDAGYLPYSLEELISFIMINDENFIRINFKKLIGVNLEYIIGSILNFDPSIELYFAGFAGLPLSEIKEKIEATKAVKISIATRNHDFKSIKELL